MRTLSLIGLMIVTAATSIIVSTPITSAVAACSPWFGCPSYSPAPGPIAGAGLPILVVLGGAYYLARRLRRNKR